MKDVHYLWVSKTSQRAYKHLGTKSEKRCSSLNPFTAILYRLRGSQWLAYWERHSFHVYVWCKMLCSVKINTTAHKNGLNWQFCQSTSPNQQQAIMLMVMEFSRCMVTSFLLRVLCVCIPITCLRFVKCVWGGPFHIPYEALTSSFWAALQWCEINQHTCSLLHQQTIRQTSRD